jgi:hypothetical protein
MSEMFIPTLHSFAMENTFTGSVGLFRFRIVPNVVKKNPKEVDFEESSIFAEYWHGLLCYEKSTMEGQETFPMTPEGRDSLIEWLETHR